MGKESELLISRAENAFDRLETTEQMSMRWYLGVKL